jgi:hypothetical protein
LQTIWNQSFGVCPLKNHPDVVEPLLVWKNSMFGATIKAIRAWFGHLSGLRPIIGE